MHDYFEFNYTNHSGERVRFRVRKEASHTTVTSSPAPAVYHGVDKWYYSENEIPPSWSIGEADPDEDEVDVKHRVVDDYIRRRAKAVHANVQVGVWP
jgi:hypothetical protein